MRVNTQSVTTPILCVLYYNRLRYFQFLLRSKAILSVNSYTSSAMYQQSILLCLVLSGPHLSVDSQPLPLSLPATQVSTGNTGICPAPNTAINEAINMTKEYLQQVGAFLSLPSSCAEIAGQNETLTPGLYWIRNGNDSATEVYCSAEGGTRVAFLNMTDPTEVCPRPWEEIIVPESVRSCVRNFTGSGCQSVFYSTNGMEYNKVCGRIIGYQYGNVAAFRNYYDNNSLTIDDVYFDGLVLTVGPPGSRQHIWTWAASLSQIYNNEPFNCICTNVGSPSPADSPPWVDNDYFCETGTTGLWGGVFYADDPLWDGEGCGPGSSCCTFPGQFIQPALGNFPPNFCKQLPFTTTDDLEIRFCRASGGTSYYGTPVQHIEMFVQLV